MKWKEVDGTPRNGMLICSSNNFQTANPNKGDLAVYKVTITHVFILVIATNIF
jgi:hypothetical protein